MFARSLDGVGSSGVDACSGGGWVCVALFASSSSRMPQHVCWGSHGGLVLGAGAQISRLARTLEPSGGEFFLSQSEAPPFAMLSAKNFGLTPLLKFRNSGLIETSISSCGSAASINFPIQLGPLGPRG